MWAIEQISKKNIFYAIPSIRRILPSLEVSFLIHLWILAHLTTEKQEKFKVSSSDVPFALFCYWL